MTPAATVLSLGIQSGVPVVIWGSPGIGKSKFMESLALALDLHIETVIASIREPSDFNGLPAIMGDGVHFVPPVWAKRLIEAVRGIAFFDEISTAAPAVQAGLLRVILDRVVGDARLPQTISMVGAANRPEEAANGYEFTAPLANRFCHQDWTLVATDWVDGMLSGWPEPSVVRLPKDWDAAIPAASAMVGSFIRHRPTMLLQVPTDASKAGRAWPSPRTWDMSARLLTAAASAGYNNMSDVAMTAVAGCVGQGPATEFLAYLKELDLPDPEEILANPMKYKLPTRSDRAFAALASVAAAVVQNATEERWLSGWKVMARAAETATKDVAAASCVSLLRLARKRPELPLPLAELKSFVPLLKAAGVMK